MTARMSLLLLTAGIAPLASGAQAAEAASQPAPCATPAELPGALSGWTADPETMTAGVAERGAPELTAGKPVEARLQPASAISYARQPGKAGDPSTSGGVFGFAVEQAGIYRVALGAGSWVDVIEDGGVVTSVMHGHGPACSGIRKMVDFPLKPGRHALQISGSADQTLRILIARLP